MNCIPIVFSINDKFAKFASVAIQSIIENASPKNQYNIYIFYIDMLECNIKKLENQKKENVEIKCIDINKYIDKKNFYEIGDYTYEIYFRYYISKILKQYEKVIYLDSDIIVLDDIAKLYIENIGEKVIAAVTDFEHYMNKKNTDFNSGVLIINTKKFEEMKIRQKCIELIRLKKYNFPDQDALNEICKNDICILNPKYNYQVSLAYYHKFKQNIKKSNLKKLFNEDPIIIHFSYITKPIYNIFSKYNNEFWKYAKNTPYISDLLNIYLNNQYDVLRNSPVEDICIDLTKEGKFGIKKIINLFWQQLKYWLIFKLKKYKKTIDKKNKIR